MGLRLIDGCFNTQPPEGGWQVVLQFCNYCCRFNTQPPEGGWIRAGMAQHLPARFNTQPPEGGWMTFSAIIACTNTFQHTAARRRLAHRLFAPFLAV